MLDRINNKQWLKRFRLEQFPEPEVIPVRNPVLLCHGYGAIATLVKPSPMYDVAMLMRSHGVLAFAPNTVPYAKIEIRARIWRDLIRELVEREQPGKLNIVAHSMGGLDIRYALHEYEITRHVESFTTISTPHRGTSLAELTLKTPEMIKDKVAVFFDWMADNIYPKSKSDTVGAIKQLTRIYAESFNRKYEDLPEIPYYSYSSAAGKGTDNPISPILRFQNNHIYEHEGINDGFVSVESAHWGEHIKTASLSHLEQISLGMARERTLAYREFWKDVLNMLAEKGH